MAIKSTYLGGTDWIDGDTLNAADLIDTFEAAYPKISEIYTGSGYDTYLAGTGTDTEDHELTAIAAANLTNKTYVIIKVLGYVRDQDGKTQIKIQAKEVGGAYADIWVYAYLPTNETTNNNTVYFEYIHTLTAGQITNGVQFKMFAETTSTNAGAINRFDNKQTSLTII